MGYNASVVCRVELLDKTIQTKQQFIDRIKYNDDQMFDLFDDWSIQGGWLKGDACCKYNDDDWYDFLDAIKDLVPVGSYIEFTGEDDNKWKFDLHTDGWYDQKVIDVTYVYNMGIKVV